MLKFISSRFIRPLVNRYLSKERSYSYGKITLKIFPGVFHPAFFFSTKFLLHHLESIDLEGKKFLEPGAGSGLISFMAERKGAMVTATDLGEAAIAGLHFNKEKLHSGITIIRSNLFDEIPGQVFDFIIINPPYYPKNPESDAQLAWYCGTQFEFFEKLFSQLQNFVHKESRIIMVLSEDCDILGISKIAAKNRFTMSEVQRKKFWWEWNYIFEVIRTA